MTKKSSIFSSIFGQFKRFDSYAPTIGFTLADEDSVPSVIGGIISIVTTLFAFYLSFKNLSDFIFRSDAEVAVGSKFENTNLEFNSDTMFMSLGFYFPYTQSSASLDAGSGNNFNVKDNIKNIKVTCVDCNKNDTVLSICKADKFKNVLISSMAVNQSNQIVNNLKKYSFCLPDKYSGNVVEDVPFGKSASIEMEMPFDRTVAPKKPEDAAKLIQTGGYSFNSVKSQVQQIDSAREQLVQEAEKQQEKAAQQYQELLNSGYDPDKFKGNECAPDDEACQQNFENLQNSEERPEVDGGAQGEPQPEDEPGIEPGGEGDPGIEPGGEGDPGVDPNGEPGVEPQPKGEPGTEPGGEGDPGVDPNGEPEVDGGAQGAEPQPEEPQRTKPARRFFVSKRNLNQNCSCMKASDYLRTSNLPWELKTLVNANLFPKLLFLHRTVTVNPENKDIVSFIYKLDILDFYDRFTSNPIVYDVYVRKVVVEKITGIFWEETEEFEYLEYEKIEPNRMDSLTNKGAKFYFKISSDVKTITVKYVTFADWLESFGAYMGVFSMVAGFLIGIFSDYIMYQKAISTIFKFNNNKPSEFRKKIFNLSQKQKSKILTSKIRNEEEEAKVIYEVPEGQNMSRSYDSKDVPIGSKGNSIGVKDKKSHRSNEDKNIGDIKFKKAFVLNRKKKKEVNKIEIGVADMLKAAWCRSCYKKQEGKFEIMDKCAEIIEECMSIEYVMKKFFELNLIKKIFFSKYERGLLKYQIRYLNIAEKDKTLDYMEELAGEKFKVSSLEKLRAEDIHESEEHLIEYLQNYYAF